jgi:hypothetical protein
LAVGLVVRLGLVVFLGIVLCRTSGDHPFLFERVVVGFDRGWLWIIATSPGVVV